MAMGMDARVRYTQMVIRSAFLELKKDEEKDKITVTDVCRKAGINRATFYKYYDNVSDLQMKIEQDTTANLYVLIDDKFSYESLHRSYLEVLRRVESNVEVYKPLFSDDENHRFASTIYRLYFDKMSGQIRSRFPQLSDLQLEWLFFFIIQGGCSILHHWVDSGMKEPAESAADFFIQMVKGVLSTIN